MDCKYIYAIINQNKKGRLQNMVKKIKFIMKNMNIHLLSSVASFALLITTIASNQRCWYVMYEDKLPKGHEKLKKSHF